MKVTTSLCPVCYKEIPAVVEVLEQVYMQKHCPVHGDFVSLVERNPQWFNYCQAQNDKEIYSGYLMDVTSRCNLSCKYCYHEAENKDVSVDELIADALAHKTLTPFILTGGEPTLHPELPVIIQKLSEIGEVNLLTNGVKLANEEYFDLITPLLDLPSGLSISLSFHKESNGKDKEFLDLCRVRGKQIATAFYVIDSIEQLAEAVELFMEYSDVINVGRIKAASNLWAEQKAEQKIFVSDMLKQLSAIGECKILTGTNECGYKYNNKVSFANVMFDDYLQLMLISWYDVNNIDLYDIDCPPYYSSKNGEGLDFVKACLMNDKEKYKTGLRVRRAFACDVAPCAELWEQMALEEGMSKNPNKVLWSSKLVEYLKTESNYLYVAEWCGEIVGFVQGSLDIDPLTSEPYLVGLCFYVKPEYRKTDVAIALHTRYKKTAKELGVTRVVRQTTFANAEHLKSKGQEVVGLLVEERLEK